MIIKELSIEEKAKRYDEAIKVAKSNYETIVQMDNDCTFAKEGIVNTFHHIFPELKESEDEKIRKELLEHCKNQAKPYIQTGNECPQIQSWISWIEKQGEQKPADKVEPRFKVGDWIINGIDVCKIKNIDLNEFNYIFENGISDISLVDNICHLWTIKDAKDGDVLCTYECDEPKIVFILKGIPKKHYALSYYCYYNIMYPHFASNSEKGCLAPNDEDVKPATKEQRDLLFQKMKDAGYEWDAEKKKLKKIKQEQTEFPNGEDYGIDGLYHAIHILEITLGKVDGYQTDDGILEHKCAIEAVNRLYKQKPAWNEEDEEIIEALISLCDEAQDNIPQLSALKNWLKSLKDRVQLKVEWGYEDNEMIGLIAENCPSKVLDWLKSLKDRVQPQPKQEWSKEDENVIEDIEEAIINYWHGDTQDILLDWLKSLRPQSQWELIDDNLPEFKDKLCELFQRFRWYKDESPTNGDILEYIDTHIQELLTIVNEQKSITPKFKINDVIKYNQKQWTIIGIDINNHCYDLDNDECVDFDTADYTFELVEQKPTKWSEEDENKLTLFMQLTEGCNNSEELTNWLKSLKNRVQLKVE